MYGVLCGVLMCEFVLGCTYYICVCALRVCVCVVHCVRVIVGVVCIDMRYTWCMRQTRGMRVMCHTPGHVCGHVSVLCVWCLSCTHPHGVTCAQCVTRVLHVYGVLYMHVVLFVSRCVYAWLVWCVYVCMAWLALLTVYMCRF